VQKTDIPNVFQGPHLQYLADNVDNNIRTIDGHGTFHGMGIIATATPVRKQMKVIPRLKVDAEELRRLARVDTKFYKMDMNEQSPIKFEKLAPVHTESYTSSLSCLTSIVWPVKR
jgi:hypothetical protein